MNTARLIGFTAALGAAMTAAASQYAGVFPGSTDFEDVTLPDSYTISDNGATIEDGTPGVDSRPANFIYNDTRAKVLSTDDAEGTVWRDLEEGGTDVALAGGTIYADFLFNASVVATDTQSAEAGDKLLVYLRADNGATNLCVYAGGNVLNGGIDVAAPGEFVLNAPVAGGSWHRIVVEALNDVTTVSGDVATDPGFKIYLDGTLCTTADGHDAFLPLSGNGNTEGTVSSVGFRGAGLVDDLVISTNDPSQQAPLPDPDTTITWPTTLTVVSYTTNGVPGDALTASAGSATITTAPGAEIVVTGTTPYGTTVSATGTSGTDFGITASASDLAWYFPQTATAGQDGSAANPFEIAEANDLIALQAAVANVAAARSLSYVQTANIDMASAGAFAGIGAYGDAALTHADAIPFTGTYNGQGCKISNVTFTDRDYAGVFNRVDGGTIKNLVVEDVSYVGTGSKFSAAIVGYALNGATLENLTSGGTFGLEDRPGSHNMAGIVIRASGGTSGDGTQILYCTNNATIYCSYTKLAGICAIAQEKIDPADHSKMVFTGCANNGTLVLNRNSNGITGLAGIVGYSDVNTTMTDCSNTGTLTQLGSGYNADCTGALIGNTYGHSITDGGNNSAPSNVKMIGKWGDATETGFLYATVGNGMATTATTLAKGTEYLLEGDAAPTFELAAEGDFIAFNTALGYTLDGTGITAAQGLSVIGATVGTVTTYTAAPAPLNPAANIVAATVVAGSESDAVDAAKGGIMVPAGANVPRSDYANYFDYEPVDNHDGTFTVTITGIRDTVTAGVYESAVARLTDENATAITIPAGLYYRITPSTSLPISGEPVTGLSTNADGSVTIGKPGTNSGFYRIELSPMPFN